MNIEYLKKFQDNSTGLKLSKISNPEGLSLNRIVELESVLNK